MTVGIIISMPGALAERVGCFVAEGSCASRSDVIRDGLRAQEVRKEEHPARIAANRDDLQACLKGEFVIMEEGLRRYHAFMEERRLGRKTAA
jgi:Arc/MetJ-type ribon-helix-helix transcriptional regulator